MQIERIDLALRNAIGLNKLDASRMHITDKLNESMPAVRYNIRQGNKLYKYTIIDDNIKVDTFEKRLRSNAFVRVAQKILGNPAVFTK